MKFNRLAVLICGDFRFWPQASDYMFQYFETFSDRVDYYFVTWSKTRDYWWPESKSILTERCVLAQDVVEKFSNKKLIGHTIIDQSVLPRYDVTFYYQAYLALQANKLKKQYENENNFVYDQVFEVRPDLYIRLDSSRGKIVPCIDKQYSIGPTWIDQEFGMEFEQIGDLMSRSSSIGNDIISQRFYHKNLNNAAVNNNRKINNHGLLLEYLRESGMIQVGDNMCQSVPIRSNFPADLGNYSFEQLGQMNRDWTNAYQHGQV